MKKYNVALFVPHKGCPNQCSFCNQKSISGSIRPLTAQDVETAAETAIRTAGGTDGEIAFFGGSFTAIERNYMIMLLEKAKPYIDRGAFKGIRISTRPDALDEEICRILMDYHVTAVELGCQSMDNGVLLQNRRGHTSEDVNKAVALLRTYPFEVGLQMMTGLYGSDMQTDIRTAQALIGLKPDTVRIYPTVVLADTPLAELYRQGAYCPPDLDETVALCAKLLLMFHEADIPVIRLGLHSGGQVEEGYLAGAYHPAFRELCEGEIYFNKAAEEIRKHKIAPGNIVLCVGESQISQMTGQKKKNIQRLHALGYTAKVTGCADIGKYCVQVREASEQSERNGSR